MAKHWHLLKDGLNVTVVMDRRSLSSREYSCAAAIYSAWRLTPNSDTCRNGILKLDCNRCIIHFILTFIPFLWKWITCRIYVLIMVVMKSSIFWDIILCSPMKVNRHFRVTYPLHLQRWSVSQARDQFESDSKYNCCLLYAGILLAYCSILKMEAICSSKMLNDFCWTTWCYIPEDITLQFITSVPIPYTSNLLYIISKLFTVTMTAIADL
jgi:hypothetical protein